MKRLIRKHAEISQDIIDEMDGDQEDTDYEEYMTNVFEIIHHNYMNKCAPVLQSLVDKYPNLKTYLNSLIAGQTLYRGVRLNSEEEAERFINDPQAFKATEGSYVNASFDRGIAEHFATLGKNHGGVGIIATYKPTECLYCYLMLNEDMDPDFEEEKDAIIKTDTTEIISVERV